MGAQVATKFGFSIHIYIVYIAAWLKLYVNKKNYCECMVAVCLAVDKRDIVLLVC